MLQGCGGGGGVCTGTCENLGWKGDGFCDDVNNNCGCDWDGGDCCGNNVNTYYCTKCDCLDPNAAENLQISSIK